AADLGGKTIVLSRKQISEGRKCDSTPRRRPRRDRDKDSSSDDPAASGIPPPGRHATSRPPCLPLLEGCHHVLAALRCERNALPGCPRQPPPHRHSSERQVIHGDLCKAV